MNFQQLSKEEKASLKQRISSSVYSSIKRRRFRKFGLGLTATCIIILLSIGFFNRFNTEDSSIETFAKTIEKQGFSDKVELVLNNKQKVDITEQNASISYSSSGEKVQIGQEESITQDSFKKNDIVFNTLIVPFGKRSEIVLSDGSKVWLNSGSKLIFPAHFASDKREVYLEGEAIFEIVHIKNQPFLVKSKNHEIEVLGTVFSVSNYKEDDAIYTVLKSGSVQINYINNNFFNTKENIKIVPGTLATFNKNSSRVNAKPVATESYFSWRDGIFIFKNDSLKSIMKKISRYYNVEIIINDTQLANETFSGSLDVKESIDRVMEVIRETESSKFDYKFTNDNKLIIN